MRANMAVYKAHRAKEASRRNRVCHTGMRARSKRSDVCLYSRWLRFYYLIFSG